MTNFLVKIKKKKKSKIKRCNEKDHDIGPNFLMYMISSLQNQIKIYGCSQQVMKAKSASDFLSHCLHLVSSFYDLPEPPCKIQDISHLLGIHVS